MDSEILEDRFIKADEAARFLRLSRGGFYALVAQGEVPFYRLCGRRVLRFRRIDIEQLLKLDQEVSNAVKKNQMK